MTMPASSDASLGMRQFDCRVWTYRNALRPAPRKPGGFASPRKGQIAATGDNTLVLSVPRQKKRVLTVSEVEGFTHEVLTAGRQLTIKLIELLAVGAGVGLALILALFLMSRGAGDLALLDVLTNLLVAFALGLVLVFLGGLIWSIPALLRMRTVDLFTLKFGDGRRWDFGVPEQQSTMVVQLLQSLGMQGVAETPVQRA